VATVALVGADGAGKTSVARQLEAATDLRVKYIYMGVNPEACNHALPTTRLLWWLKYRFGKAANAGGPPDPAKRETEHRARSPLKRVFGVIKGPIRLANQIAEEWYRQVLSWHYQRRGFVVLFDRHFFPDYYAHDINNGFSRRRLLSRLHGFFLERFYPKPDFIVLLDAPASVLYERKGEGTVELIEQRRQEYFQLRDLVPRFAVVQADQPVEKVMSEVRDIIRDLQPEVASGGERPAR